MPKDILLRQFDDFINNLYAKYGKLPIDLEDTLRDVRDYVSSREDESKLAT